jgi:2-keto-3-deoxy-L-rhamnonate aldolase RhmA
MTHPLLDEENRTWTKLRAGQTTHGLFLLTASSIVAEACTTLPIDWLIVDMEASPVSHQGLLHMLQAISGTAVTPLVRLRFTDHHRIEQALDLGAQGVLLPKVEDRAAAERVAAACRYPPEGRRGINPVRASAYFSDVPRYLATANRRCLCLVQIESREAVENAAEIAAVPGVDGLFIGCGDLASSLGQPGVVVGEEMDRARAKVLEAAVAHGKVPGIFAYGTDLARRYAAEGFRLIAFGNDVQALREGVLGRLRAIAERP